MRHALREIHAQVLNTYMRHNFNTLPPPNKIYEHLLRQIAVIRSFPSTVLDHRSQLKL
jgi:hypothetical protein